MFRELRVKKNTTIEKFFHELYFLRGRNGDRMFLKGVVSLVPGEGVLWEGLGKICGTGGAEAAMVRGKGAGKALGLWSHRAFP